MPSISYPDKTENEGDPNNRWTASDANMVKSVVNAKADGTHTHTPATTTVAGFMSASDKVALAALAEIAGDIVVDSDTRLSDSRPLLVSPLDHTPNAEDDSTANWAVGDAVSYGGQIYICRVSTPGNAQWVMLGGGTGGSALVIVEGADDPAAAPPNVGALYRNTTTKALWLAAGTSSAADWRPVSGDAGSTPIADLDAPPDGTDDSAHGFVSGQMGRYDDILYLCLDASPDEAIWLQLTSGLIITKADHDPDLPPAVTPGIWLNEASGGLWFAVNDDAVEDWIPLNAGGLPMLESTYNPEGKEGQIVVEDELDDYLKDDDLEEIGEHTTGSTATLLAGFNGKRVRVNTATVVVPAGLPEGFYCTLYRRGSPWTLAAGSGVSLNGVEGDTVTFGPAPVRAELYAPAANDFDLLSGGSGGGATAAAPVVVGSLADVVYNWHDGTKTIDASPAFTGSDITYGLDSPPSGVTINAATGLISIDLAATGAILTPDVVTVTATNSGGSVDVDFDLTVTAYPVLRGTEIILGNGATLTSPSIAEEGDLLEVFIAGKGTSDPDFGTGWTEDANSGDDSYKGALGHKIVESGHAGAHVYGGFSTNRTFAIVNVWKADTFNPTTPVASPVVAFSSNNSQVYWNGKATPPVANAIASAHAWSPAAMQPGLLPGATQTWARAGGDPNGRGFYKRDGWAEQNVPHTITGAACTRAHCWIQGPTV